MSTSSPPGWRAYALVAMLAAALYSHPRMLDGEFVYDDGGTITGNPVTLGQVPWSQLWKRDYWGKDHIASRASHKSYRPITSVSFRLNFYYSISAFGRLKSRGFHIVNVALHVTVSVLVVFTAHLAFGGAGTAGSSRAASFTGLVFAAHPIHSEAVQNITGRAELLMALFYLLGFVGYARSVVADADAAYGRWRATKEAIGKSRPLFPSSGVWVALLVIVPCCTLLALLSKEMGATLPMLCSFWDFFSVERLALPHLVLWAFEEHSASPEGSAGETGSGGSFSLGCGSGRSSGDKQKGGGRVFTREAPGTGNNLDRATAPEKTFQPLDEITGSIATEQIDQQRRLALPPVRWRLARWGVRTAVLAGGTVVLFAWRVWLNGGHKPYFRYNSNRHAIEPLYSGRDPMHPLYRDPAKVVGPDVGVHGPYRAASIAWIWCHYLFACASPAPVLSPDWSAGSIPLVTKLSPLGPRLDEFGTEHASGDPRALLAALTLLGGASIVAFASGCLDCTPRRKTAASAESRALRQPLRRTHPPVLACVAFYVFPFLLASNLFVVVGTTVAERVAYLPSLGVCMAYGLLLNATPDAWWLPVHELMPFVELVDTEMAAVAQQEKAGIGAKLDGDEDETMGVVKNEDDEYAEDVKNKYDNQAKRKGREKGAYDGEKLKSRERKRPNSALSGLYRPWNPPVLLLRKRTALAQLGVLLLVLAAMAQRCLQRNFAWTNQVELWAAAHAVNPKSAHTCQNYGINLSINNGVPQAIEVLESARRMEEVDRVDSDEIFPTLAMCLKAVGRWHEALEVLAEGWAIVDARAAAIAAGVEVWHMHELIPEGEQGNLKRGRLLAAQGTILTRIDLREAASCMAKAIRLAPEDPLVVRLVSDLESHLQKYVANPQQQQFHSQQKHVNENLNDIR